MIQVENNEVKAFRYDTVTEMMWHIGSRASEGYVLIMCNVVGLYASFRKPL